MSDPSAFLRDLANGLFPRPEQIDVLLARIDAEYGAMTPEQRWKLRESALKQEYGWHAMRLACDRHELHQHEDALLLAKTALDFDAPGAARLVATIEREIAAATTPPTPVDDGGEPLVFTQAAERLAEITAQWRQAVAEGNPLRISVAQWAVAHAARDLVRVVNGLELSDQPPQWMES